MHLTLRTQTNVDPKMISDPSAIMTIHNFIKLSFIIIISEFLKLNSKLSTGQKCSFKSPASSHRVCQKIPTEAENLTARRPEREETQELLCWVYADRNWKAAESMDPGKIYS